MVELKYVERRKQSLLKKRKSKSAKVFALLGSLSLPLAFFGAWGRAMEKVVIEDLHPAVEAMKPMFGLAGDILLGLSAVSFICMLIFYLAYNMVFCVLKSYLHAVWEAFKLGISIFLIGAIITTGLTIMFYGIGIVFFPILFASRYYKRIDEWLMRTEAELSMATGYGASTPTKQPLTNNQPVKNNSQDRWEVLFASIRNEPACEADFVEPFDNPLKGWRTEWGGDLIINASGQFEILNRVSVAFYAEIKEQGGKIEDFRIKPAEYDEEGENKIPEITSGFLSQNPKEQMQFIPLSSSLAILIFTNLNQTNKKIWKLIREFPEAPETIDATYFEQSMKKFEDIVWSEGSPEKLNPETKTVIQILIERYEEKALWYYVTGHPKMQIEMRSILAVISEYLHKS